MKGLTMFRQVSVPILGMIQNMSTFVCPHCSKATSVFGSEGVEKECAKNGLELLADISLDARVCADADCGRPTVVADPDGESAKRFLQTARRIVEKMEG